MSGKRFLITYAEFARAVRTTEGRGTTWQAVILPKKLFDKPLHAPEFLFDAFARVADVLDDLEPGDLRESSVCFTIVPEELPTSGETAKGSPWNPLASLDSLRKGSPREMLLSWLVLSFPEVRWSFWGKPRGSDDFGIDPLAWHLMEVGHVDADIRASLVPSLFDPSGLRAAIRMASGVESVESLPIRRRIAASIDEEESYAYLLGYLGYRLGYRTWAITQWEAMRQLLASSKKGPELIFEDLYLNFPDRPAAFDPKDGSVKFFPLPEERHLSNLAFRDSLCPSLKLARRRLFVTVGHQQGRSSEAIASRNEAYIASLAGAHHKILKPVSGLYQLLSDAHLWNQHRCRPKFAEGFNNGTDRHVSEEKESHHSAPGRFLMIAGRMMARCRAIMGECTDTVSAVHAAVLALEAREFLGGRTPTTALETLALQHEAEVTAESLFLGVEYNLPLKERLAEIEQEVAAMGHWFDKGRRKRSTLNAQLTVAERLAKRFNDLNQLEEELQCLGAASGLRFDFWMAQKWWHRLLWPALRYISFAMKSLLHFAGAVAILIVLFAFFYWYLPGPSHSFLDSVAASGYFMATLQPAPAWADNFRSVYSEFLLMVQGFMAYFNLGLLVSHLYLLVTRR
jgi:hypothetical protein